MERRYVQAETWVTVQIVTVMFVLAAIGITASVTPRIPTEADAGLHSCASNGSTGQGQLEKGTLPDDESTYDIRLQAERGDVVSAEVLALKFEQVNDHVEAAKWRFRAADLGNHWSQLRLGFSFRLGRGVKCDDTEALKWFKMAAISGLYEAEREVGRAYDAGLGTKQDFLEAEKWYRLAALKGDPESQYLLGRMLKFGAISSSVPNEARLWILRAADQGYFVAIKSIAADEAEQCRNAPGSNHCVTAYKWLNLPIVKMLTTREISDEIEALMTPDQITEAKKLALDWRPQKGAVLPSN